MDFLHKPRLIVFDLDHTLFDFFIDEIDPEWAFDKSRTVEELSTRWPLYPEINQVFQAIKALNIPIAIASMAKQIQWGEKLVEKFGLKNFIELGDDVIVVGRKDGYKYNHFDQIMKAYNEKYAQISEKENNNKPFEPIKHNEIVFFDDYDHNHKCLGKLGVHGFLCNARGVTMENFRWMMEKYDHSVTNNVTYPYNIVWEEFLGEKMEGEASQNKFDKNCIFKDPPKAILDLC